MSTRLIITLLLMSMTLSPHLAWGDRGITFEQGFSTVTVLSALSVGWTAYNVGLTSSDLTEDTEHTQGNAEQEYLKQNQADVIEGLATGQGQFINDLTLALNIPHHKRHIFTQKLTDRYEELVELVDTERITPSRANRFFNVIVKLSAQV